MIEKSNWTTCQACEKPLPKDDCTAYITQTYPHYFFFLCDACEAVVGEIKSKRAEAES